MSGSDVPRGDDPVSDDRGPDLSKMDAQARRFLAMVALGASDAAQVSADERRASFERLMRFSKPPAGGVETSDRAIEGCGGAIPVRLYTPSPMRQPCPGLVYFHGGGLVAGSIDTHDALCKSLAVGADCRVLSVGYRLAPEHPFPAAIVDALVATRTILRNADAFGLDPGRIGVGGDSGGATLATIVARTLRRRLKAQVLLCPVLDLAGLHPSKRAFGKGFLLDEATMARDLVDYAPSRPLADPHVSPLHGKGFAGLPRTLVYIAGFDPLRDEGAAYAASLGEAGVDVTLTCYGSLIHHFYGLTGVIPAAGVALSAIAKDVGRALA